MQGSQQGVTGPYRLNIHNKNPQAAEIAMRKMAAVCYAIGVMRVDNVNQMIGKPFMVEVQTQNNDPQYTEVTKVFDANGNEPRKGGAPAPSQPPAQPSQAPPAAPAWAGQVVSQPQPAQPPAPVQMPPQPQAPAPVAQPAAPAAPAWQNAAPAPAAPAPAPPARAPRGDPW